MLICGSNIKSQLAEQRLRARICGEGDAAQGWRDGADERQSPSRGHGRRGSSITPKQPGAAIRSLLPALLLWLRGDSVQTCCLQETRERQASNGRAERGARW